MGYRTIIARYVAKWGIAQMCLCETKYQGGVSHHLGEVLTSPKKYCAIWGIAAIVSQYRAIFSEERTGNPQKSSTECSSQKLRKGQSTTLAVFRRRIWGISGGPLFSWPLCGFSIYESAPDRYVPISSKMGRPQSADKKFVRARGPQNWNPEVCDQTRCWRTLHVEFALNNGEVVEAEVFEKRVFEQTTLLNEGNEGGIFLEYRLSEFIAEIIRK